MKSTAEPLKISVTEYLEGELLSEIKHEYINGDVYAVAGVKRAHNIVSMNLLASLCNHLQGTPCQVFNSDMKVGIQSETEDFFITLICTLVARKQGMTTSMQNQN